MKIRELEIKDWGPHRHLVIDMDDPVVGIIGTNGSGKSNVLQALNYALTGNLNKRTGQSYIRNYGTPDGAEKASVKVRFVAGDKEGTIYREIGVKSSKRELVWDGVTYRKDADVKRLMREIVGADDAALANAVFILQGTTADLVKGTPAERNDIFRKLMNLNFVDARANDLLSKASALRAGITDYTEVLCTLKNRLERLEEEQELLQQKAESLRPLAEAGPLVNKLKDTMASTERMEEELGWNSGQEARHTERAAEIRKELGMAGASASEVLASISGDLSRLGAVDRDLGVWEALRNNSAAADAALAHAKSAMENLDRVRRECGNPNEEHLAALRSRKDKQESIVRLIKLIADETQTLKNLKDRRMELQTRIELCKESVEELQKAAPDPAAVAREIQAVMLRASVAHLKVKSLESGVTETCPCCGGPLVITESKLQLDGIIQDAMAEKYKLEKSLKDSDEAIAAAGRDLPGLEVQLGIADGEIERFKAHIEILSDQLDTDSDGMYTPSDLDTASGALDTLSVTVARTESDLSAVRNAEAVASNARDALDRAKSALAAVGDLPSRTEQELRSERDGIHTRVTRIKALAGQLEAEEKAILECVRKNRGLVSSIETNVAEVNALLADSSIIAVREAFAEASDGQEQWEACRAGGSTVMGGYWDAASKWVASRSGVLTETMAQLERKKAEVDTAVSEIDDYSSKVKKNDLRKRTADDLDTIRAVVGKNGAPLLYMNSVFASVSSIVQELLSRMGSNFTVSPDPSQPVTFVFKRTDDDSGFVMAQEQLSGGQAIRLALAMLIAAQQVILPEVGLLVLDEPSSHIDADGVENMRDMFRNMSGFLESAGMQLIIVDHNEVLAGAFGKTVNLAVS